LEAIMLVEQDFHAVGYNAREVRRYFLNPCCFGDDVIEALRERVEAVAPSLAVGEPVQEDYGWGFWVHAGGDPYWTCVSLVDGEGDPPLWRLIVDYDPGLNLLKRWFGRPDPAGRARVEDALRKSLTGLPGVSLA
jgi:hypothetical protein